MERITRNDVKQYFTKLLFDRQLRSVGRTVVICFLISGAVIVGITMLGYYTGKPLDHLTIDPADILMAPAYIGVLSHLGVMLWSASAAFCLLGTVLLTHGLRKGESPPAPGESRRRAGRRFLFWSGAVCALLMFDDALLVHDRVFPDFLGVPETLVYVMYAGIAGFYLISFVKRILSTDYFLLFLAMLFLGLSVLMDRILPFTPLETFLKIV